MFLMDFFCCKIRVVNRRIKDRPTLSLIVLLAVCRPESQQYDGENTEALKTPLLRGSSTV
jgi:hypothetical protein